MGDRILVAGESGETGSRNGIYTVTSIGGAGSPWILTRSTDADSSAEIKYGMIVVATEGGTYANTSWVLTTTGTVTVGTTAITFIQGGFAKIRTGGTGFIKADGSVDSNTYLTSLSHNHGIANSAGTQQFTFGVGNDVRIAGGGSTSIAFDSNTKKITISSTDTNTTYSASNGVTLTGTTFSHTDTSSQANTNNSGRTYIQNLSFDTYGHVTGVATATETVTDTNTYLSAASFNTGNGILTLTRNGSTAITVDLDGKYAESTHTHDDRYYTETEINNLQDRLAFTLRANNNITGGGTITVNASSYLKWNQRFIVISNGRGSNFTTAGYFDITTPASGTTIAGVGGAANRTATSDGILLNIWEALYYILPLGSNNGSLPANFRVANYSSDTTIPDNWVLLALNNAEDGKIHIISKYALKANESINTTVYDAKNADLLDCNHASAFQLALTNPVTGTGAANHIAYWSSPSGIAHDSNQLVWNAANNLLGVGIANPSGSTLNIKSNTTGAIRIEAHGQVSYWDIYSGYNNSNPDLIFKANGAERFRCSEQGYFGINNTAPGSLLAIKGVDSTSNNSSLNITNSNNSTSLFVRNDQNAMIYILIVHKYCQNIRRACPYKS